MVIIAALGVFIVATSIPSFLASREAGQRVTTTAQLKANEAGVIAALRKIYSAEAASSITNTGNYGTFGDLSAATLLDATWTGTPTKNGYNFRLTPGPNGLGYCVTAERTSGSTGDNSYALSNQGTIYQLAGDAAPTCDPDTGLISTGTVLGG
jgi:hypothetical protein